MIIGVVTPASLGILLIEDEGCSSLCWTIDRSPSFPMQGFATDQQDQVHRSRREDQ